ncbi:MAG: DUF455 family protein [Candidatus Latescibacteria bacterium]|nr:DUF455 family protein [Candidatus Latescibacterota bacterium]
MEIRAFAERVLFGTTWEEKLGDLDRVEDGAPGTPLEGLPKPGRPGGLELDRWSGDERTGFGQVRQLHTEKQRGLVLHFFANHELLALELMALALLKFPGAPRKFRRGLLQTLRDEQQHVQLYRQRMDQVGVDFGQIPVSDFFWRTIAPMETPLDFVARLSLTLEQANLDYAVYYAGLYRGLGDEATAAILDRIYRDEIGHVKHGLVWFNRWRDPELSEWEAYKRVLRDPLSPSRARGIGFNQEGRRRAGLSAEFIGELQLFARSKGRCPDVYWFDPACEGQVAMGRAGAFTPSAPVRQLQRDLAGLPVLLCRQDDIVLVPQRPSADFLRRLLAAGFTLPEFVEYGVQGLSGGEILERKIHRVQPWGFSPDSARFLQPLLGAQTAAAPVPGWRPQWRQLYAKTWSAELLTSFLATRPEGYQRLCGTDVVGVSCTGMDQVQEQLARWRAQGHQQVVIKGAFGASGQQQVQVPAGLLRPGQEGWVSKLLAQQGAVVVEPWLDKVCDLSLHYQVEADGVVRWLGWTRFFTDARGQYQGSFIARPVAGLDIEARKLLYAGGRKGRWMAHLGQQLGDHLHLHLAGLDYVGPIGVDALIYREGVQLRLKPVVELNPRFTMGRVALRLVRRVNAARTALWLILRQRDMETAGFASVAAFAKHVQNTWPLAMMPDGLQISDGVLCTTDPFQAQGVATLLVVGRDLDQCRGYFADLPGGLGAWTQLV